MNTIKHVNVIVRKTKCGGLILGAGLLITGGILLKDHIYQQGSNDTLAFMNKFFPEQYSAMVDGAKELLKNN